MTTATESTTRDAGSAATRPAGRQQPSLLLQEWRTLLWGSVIFVTLFGLPLGWSRFDGSLAEALALTRWYAQEHFVFCLVPAFFIAGAMGVFVSRGAVMKYLGPTAAKPVAYGVAAVSGSVLAVCSCTVLPLFAGIRRMGAGLGPATAFLYSGPAVNVLAIVLTAAVLGPELGAARAIGAVVFSVLIGLAMHFIYRGEEAAKVESAAVMPEPEENRPLARTALCFAAMIGILIFANWSRPEADAGPWHAVWSVKWILTSLFGLGLAAILVAWFGVRRSGVLLAVFATAAAWAISAFWLVPTFGARLPGHLRGLPYEAMIPFVVGTIGLVAVLAAERRSGESNEWLDQTWGFAKQITPLLLLGVFVAGFLLGRPGGQGLIPGEWIGALVGGNSVRANLLASVIGAFMYFATLTEVPILQGLMGNGMGKGPALALLLAGPALSLPNMLVIRSILGTQKTLVFISLVIVMATLSGLIYGALF